MADDTMADKSASPSGGSEGMKDEERPAQRYLEAPSDLRIDGGPGWPVEHNPLQRDLTKGDDYKKKISDEKEK
ncbi:Uu.00g053280.m01.CDS01 [Anthostomella pinea]|uniref:Uu.00g053280.m01.CDS01 n=1 Tax=Anthostomella pinea TaxID=933095 RepID=A0AAI8VXL5_9PEZI|nr:Uu.00g053280.m01.CDS01 [Anthostomella pinea]